MKKLDKEWEYEGKKYIFTMPTIGQSNAADLEYSKAYTDAIKNGLLPRAVLAKDFKEKGIWTDKDNEDLDTILEKLQEQMAILRTAIDQEEKEKAKLALRRIDYEYQELHTRRIVTFQHSCDSKGEAARLLELTWRCALDEKKQPIWKSKEEFLTEQDSGFISELVKELLIFTNGLEEKVNSVENFIDEVNELKEEVSTEEAQVEEIKVS